MKRIGLVEFGTHKITEDTKLAVDLLIKRARNFGWVIDLCDTPITTDLAPSGREICFEMKHIDGFNTDTQDQINALWGLAIPMGFTPYNRYPLNDSISFMFHYLGCWQPLTDRILAEGRGNHLWSSLVCACLVDIGEWKGNKALVRMIQTQLHRIGYNCGIIDGIVGSRTLKCIQANNLQGLELSEIAEILIKADKKDQASSEKTTKGFVSLPNRQFQVTSYGKVLTVKNNNGVAIESGDTGGRLIIDIGEIL
jgi:hypothetical protein